MVNPKDVEYARSRYTTMSFKQLHTRLGRMTKPEKLLAFATVVEEDLMEWMAPGGFSLDQIQKTEQFSLLVAINDKRGAPTVIVPPAPKESKRIQAVIRKPPVNTKTLGAVDKVSKPKRKIPRRRIKLQ
jgi:hypothetical protein